MRKYYTRPCNLYYGKSAIELINNKKALSLANNPNIAFNQIEIFERKTKRNVRSRICFISEIKNLPKKIRFIV